MRIRTARVEDLKACAGIDISYETEMAWQMEELRAENEYGARFQEVRLPRKQHVQPALSPEERLKSWDGRDGFWVAVERRQIVGYLAAKAELEHRQVRITDLGVSADFRRQGIATALLERVTEWGLRLGAEQLVFECPTKAQPALAFAFKHRFTFCGYQDGYWPGQEVALFFRLRIRK